MNHFRGARRKVDLEPRSAVVKSSECMLFILLSFNQGGWVTTSDVVESLVKKRNLFYPVPDAVSSFFKPLPDSNSGFTKTVGVTPDSQLPDWGFALTERQLARVEMGWGDCRLWQTPESVTLWGLLFTQGPDSAYIRSHDPAWARR